MSEKEVYTWGDREGIKPSLNLQHGAMIFTFLAIVHGLGVVLGYIIWGI